MYLNFIKNIDEVAKSDNRKDALSIVCAGLSAINTKTAIKNSISVEDGILLANGNKFPLKNFERVSLFAIGKASIDAVQALEEILGDKINSGIGVDKKSYKNNNIEIFEGTHPYPSETNIEISKKMVEKAESLTEKDLAIVVVSGGGSALFCYPESEKDQGSILYESFLKSGGSIIELNTIRKHLSGVKGGGFAKILYPATVVALIICDVPGDHYGDVASAPTYKDASSIENAKDLLKKYNIEDGFSWNETPKDDIYFEKVFNIPVISNTVALSAMKDESEKLGYKTNILSSEFFCEPKKIVEEMLKALDDNTAVIVGGEPSVKVSENHGIGARNQYTVLSALSQIQDTDTFLSISSDGIDNKSKYAGAIIDKKTKEEMINQRLNLDEALNNFDSEQFLAKTKDLIETGDTGSNVSDLILVLRK